MLEAVLKRVVQAVFGGKRAILSEPKLILRGEASEIYGKFVAFPRVIQHPRGETPVYMLFQGFSTPPPGLYRKLFLGSLTDTFLLQDVREILAPDHFGADYNSFGGYWVIYDTLHDGWIMFITVQHATLPWAEALKMAFLRWDKTFTTITYESFPMSITPSGAAAEEWRAGDAALSLISLPKYPAEQKTMGLTYIAHSPTAGDLTGLYWMVCDNIEADPPVFTRSRIRAYPSGVGPYFEVLMSPSFLDLGEVLAFIGDVSRKSFVFNLGIIYMANIQYQYELTVDRIGGIAGRVSTPMPFHAHLVALHPFITTLPDNTVWNLFYATQSPNAWSHDIWVVKVDPEALRPKNQETITWAPWYETAIADNETSPIFNAGGKKTIYFSSSVSGDLTVQVNPTGDGVWHDLFTRTGITSCVDQTTYEALQMRLKFSAAATVTAIIVQSFH